MSCLMLALQCYNIRRCYCNKGAEMQYHQKHRKATSQAAVAAYLTCVNCATITRHPLRQGEAEEKGEPYHEQIPGRIEIHILQVRKSNCRNDTWRYSIYIFSLNNFLDIAFRIWAKKSNPFLYVELSVID